MGAHEHDQPCRFPVLLLSLVIHTICIVGLACLSVLVAVVVMTADPILATNAAEGMIVLSLGAYALGYLHRKFAGSRSGRNLPY